MTSTISRARLRRGTRNRTRDIVRSDSTAPKRRYLKGTGPDRAERPRKTSTVTKATSRSRTRRRPRAGGIGVPEPGRDGLGATLANTSMTSTRSRRAPGARPASREAAKLGRIRDGRYGRSRSRFVV